MRRAAMRVWVVLLALGLVASLPASASAKKERMTRCERTTLKLQKAKTVKATAHRRMLERVLKKDPKCVEAVAAVFELMGRHWDELVPEPTREVPQGVVRVQLKRFDALTDMVRTMLSFRRSPLRPQIALSLGQLYERMSDYTDAIGGVPDQLFLIKPKHAVYHTRAVDIREYLKLQAEENYRLVTSLLSEAKPTNPVLTEARERIRGLNKRYEERRIEAEERARRAEEAEAEKEAALAPVPPTD